jgi:hypothetical protein
MRAHLLISGSRPKGLRLADGDRFRKRIMIELEKGAGRMAVMAKTPGGREVASFTKELSRENSLDRKR